jgi:hypothetical protein
MQRSIVGSAWEIQASRPVVGRYKIVVSQESPSVGVESGSFFTESCAMEECVFSVVAAV